MSRDAWVVGNWSDNDDARERPETAGSLRCDPRCVVQPTDAVRRLMPAGAGAARAHRRCCPPPAPRRRVQHLDRHRATRGVSITADEPFYLVTTQSLLQDRNLDLRNQYRARSYEAFFDHPGGLWTQYAPLADGRELSPHNVGLSVLLLPGFAISGLVGAQVQLVLIAALTWALAYVLALRLTGARPWLVWLATALVALSATGYIYSSEVYPEIPAGLVLVGVLLLTIGPDRPSVRRVAAVVVLLSTLPWRGAKHAPLAALHLKDSLH